MQSLRSHQNVRNLRLAARLKSLQQRGKHREEAQARAADLTTTARRVIAAAQSSRKLLSLIDAIHVRLQSRDTIPRMRVTANLQQTTNPIGNFAAVANYYCLNAGSDKQRRESEYAQKTGAIHPDTAPDEQVQIQAKGGRRETVTADEGYE